MSFHAVLEKLMLAPGAVASSFMDPQGQPIEQIGDPDTIEVLGAYQSVWLTELGNAAGRAGIGALQDATYEFDSRRLVACEVKDGYFLLVVFESTGVPSMTRSRLDEARLELAAEIS